MKIELLHFTGCPNVDRARSALARAMETLGGSFEVEERDGDFPSPTILVDGVDVMGAPLVTGRACRLDVPTEDRVLAALRRALGAPP